MPKYRCNFFMDVMHGSIHTICIRSSWKHVVDTPLRTQCALLFLLLNRGSKCFHSPRLAHHKAAEDMARRLMRLRKAWVEEKELIVFGNGKTWMDV